jgi:hypothetical protein
VNGTEIDLKNKEYELLLFLVLNVDVVFNAKRSTNAFGAWTPWETTPLLPFTLTACGIK